MKKPATALETSLLPQYRSSATITERFLVAAHEKDKPIERSQNKKPIKATDDVELNSDFLNYFTKNTEKFRIEFTEELEPKIGKQTLKLFCEIVSEEWFDGKRSRQEGRCRQLKRSIYDYLCKVTSNTDTSSKFAQFTDSPTDVDPLFSAEDIASILTTNDQMIYRHIEQWKENHPNSDQISSNDIFLRRGLSLENEINTDTPYQERDLISSYSIALSTPEQFAQAKKGLKPAIIHGEISLFENRIIFFSPFIHGMNGDQLEFGIILSESPLPIHFQGVHSGFLEYLLDPAPFEI